MVSAEVALVPATGEADGAAAAAPKPVVGAFTVDGLTFAVVGPSQVELVEARVTAPTLDAEALSGPMAPVEPASLVLPEAVEHDGVAYALASIGDEAFANAAVEVVGLPATVMTVDEGAFRGSLVQRVEVDPASECLASYDGALYSADLTRLLSIPGGRLGTVRISDKAEEVPASVFSHCTGVDAVEVDAGSAAYSSRNGCLYDASGTLLWAPPGSAEAAALAVPSAEASADAEGADGEGLVEGIPDSGATGDGSDGMEGLSAVQPSILDSFAAMGDGITTVADGLPAAGADGDGDGLPAASLGEAAASRNKYDLTLNAGGGTIYVTDKALKTLSSPSSSNLTVECGCTSMRVRLLPGYPGAIHFQHGADHSNNQYRLWVRPGYKVTGFRDVANSGDYALTESWLGMAGKARTLEPTWSPQSYTITLDANGGSMTKGTGGSQSAFEEATYAFTYKEGMRVSDIGDAARVARKGYRHLGWSLVVNGLGQGGGGVGSSSVSYQPDALFASSDKVDIAVARGQSVKLMACWRKLVRITWDTQGGSAIAPTDQEMVSPNMTNLAFPADPTRAGYAFAGWYTAATGGAKVEAPYRLPFQDTTYYARWEPNSYRLAFDGQGGTVEHRNKLNELVGSGPTVATASSYLRSHSVNLNVFAEPKDPAKGNWDYFNANRPGYSWKGWSLSKSGGKVLFGDETIKLTADTTVYAQWEAIAYRLAFDGQGGTVEQHRTFWDDGHDEVVASGPSVAVTSTILRSHSVNHNVFVDPSDAERVRWEYLNATRPGYSWKGCRSRSQARSWAARTAWPRPSSSRPTRRSTRNGRPTPTRSSST